MLSADTLLVVMLSDDTIPTPPQGSPGVSLICFLIAEPQAQKGDAASVKVEFRDPPDNEMIFPSFLPFFLFLVGHYSPYPRAE